MKKKDSALLIFAVTLLWVNKKEINHLRLLVKKLTEFIAEYEEKRTKKNCREK